jgi:hypothetical protein
MEPWGYPNTGASTVRSLYVSTFEKEEFMYRWIHPVLSKTMVWRTRWFAALSKIQPPLLLQRISLSVNPFFFALSLLLHHFFSFNGHGTAPQTTRSLYDDLKRRTQGNTTLLTILSIFVLSWLTLAFCITASFFLSRSNGMATDIGSLAPGMDGHAVRLGIGCKGIRKTAGTLLFFY